MPDGRAISSPINAKLGGRPKKASTLIAEQFRNQLAEEIRKDAKAWIDAIKDSAMGVKIVDEDGNTYTRAPDPNAWQKATERAFGKTPNVIEDEEGNQVGLQIIVQAFRPEITVNPPLTAVQPQASVEDAPQ